MQVHSYAGLIHFAPVIVSLLCLMRLLITQVDNISPDENQYSAGLFFWTHNILYVYNVYKLSRFNISLMKLEFSKNMT